MNSQCVIEKSDGPKSQIAEEPTFSTPLKVIDYFVLLTNINYVNQLTIIRIEIF